MVYFLFILGFVFLIFGAKFLVDGAASIGKKSGLSQLVIGLTVVALGTSLPELVINVFASIENNTGLAIGNVLGSNIMNTLLIIGIAAMIYPIKMAGRKCRTDVLFNLLAILVLLVLANDSFFGKPDNLIDKADGFILLALLMAFLYYTFFIEKKETSKENSVKEYSLALSLAYLGGGAIGLFFGGKWIVNGAGQIAGDMGVSNTFIGLTIVAVSTSLPELVTSVIAALKKNTDLALGNAIGSNIFNIFLVLGSSSIITPIPFNPDLNIELGILFVAGLLLILFIRKDFGRQKRAVSRLEGGLLISAYLFYILYLVFLNPSF
ncbi:MAG: calcium/sodium antiporter [Bacteroidales bacterium]|nr:calcium/sodium antiporter [Bacteroidales bacterium]